MQGHDPRWSDEVRRWAEQEANAPRVCGRCGGLGRYRRLVSRKVRPCRSCHGSGGAVDDERAWWRAAR
jgi:DnaJ-class molecular chaperone